MLYTTTRYSRYGGIVSETETVTPRKRHLTPSWKPTYTKVLLMVQKGVSVDEIAAEVQLSKKQVFKIQSREDFKQKMQAIENKIHDRYAKEVTDDITERKVRKRLLRAAVKAADVLCRVVYNRKNIDPEKNMAHAQLKLQYEAARDILDRTGFKAVEVIETREREHSLEELESMKKTMLELQSMTERLTHKPNEYLLNLNAQPASIESGENRP